MAECGRRAKNDATRDHPSAFLWPLSVTLSVCEWPPEHAPDPHYVAEVTAHGPYGIPFASANVTTRDIEWSTLEGDVIIGTLALLTGVGFVSIPFTFFWLRHLLRRRSSLAT